MSRRVLILLLIVSLLAPAGARAAGGSTFRPPTLLWKTFPLVQRPATIDKTPPASAAPAQKKVSPKLPPVVKKAQTGFSVRHAAPVAQTAESTRLRNTLVLGLLLASLVAMMAILLMQNSVAIRVGGPRRDRPRPRPPLPKAPPAVEPSGDPLEPLRPNPPTPKFGNAPRQGFADRERVLTAEVGEIKIWRGFTKCRLYATLSGSDEAFAVTPYFRSRDAHPPGAAAEDALAGLLTELELGGWEAVPDHQIWYRHRLIRNDPAVPSEAGS